MTTLYDMYKEDAENSRRRVAEIRKQKAALGNHIEAIFEAFASADDAGMAKAIKEAVEYVEEMEEL